MGFIHFLGITQVPRFLIYPLKIMTDVGMIVLSLGRINEEIIIVDATDLVISQYSYFCMNHNS